MIKKANKNQVIKDVILENSFKDQEKVYIPVSLSKNYCEFFNVSYLVPVFIPKNFKLNLDDTSEELNSRFNQGYDINNKPLYIKSFQNKEVFAVDDIEDNLIQSQTFKKIYAKNIISSNNQENFLAQQNFIGDLSSKKESFLSVIATPISLIQEATFIENSTNSFFSDIIIKVYAFNNNNEIVDNITVESGNINTFALLEGDLSGEFEDLIINSLFAEFANSVTVNIDAYNQENFFNNSNIRGVSVNYNNNLLRSLYNPTVISDYDPSSINITLEHEGTGSTYSLFRITGVNEVVQDYFTTNLTEFSYNLLSDQEFGLFVLEVENYLNRNDLSSADLLLDINFSYNDKSINVEKNINILKNKVVEISRSLELFDFENKIVRGDIASLNIDRIIDSASLSVNKKYEINLNFNNQAFSRETIFNNTVKLIFRTSNNFYIEDITEFYFDSDLSEGNSVFISENVEIHNYMGNNLNENLYFEYTANDDIESCFLRFYATNYGLDDFITIGPFYVRSSRSLQSPSANDFLQASNSLGSSIEFVTNRSEDEIIRDVMTSTRYPFDRWEINFDNVITSPEFQNLNYFNVDEDLNSLEEKINNLVANIVVRVKKTLFCDYLEIHQKTVYLQLSSIIRNLAITSTRKFAQITNFDICDLFSDNPLFFNNLDIANNKRDIILKFINNEDINEEFNLRYNTEFSFLIAQNNTFNKLGTPSVSGGNSFVSFINQVTEELETNYNVSEVVQLRRRLFSNEFFNDIDRNLLSIFNTLSFDNFFNFTHTVDYRQDARPQEQQSTRLTNYLINTVDPTINDRIDFSSNLNLALDQPVQRSSGTISSPQSASFSLVFHNRKSIVEINADSSVSTRKVYEGYLDGTLSNVKAILYPIYVCSKKNTAILNNSDSNSIVKTFDDNENIYITFNKTISKRSSLDCLVLFKNNKISINSNKAKTFNEDYYNNLLSTMLSSIVRSGENDIIIRRIMLRLVLSAKVKNETCLITLNIKPFITEQSRDIIREVSNRPLNEEDFNLESSLVNRLIYDKVK